MRYGEGVRQPQSWLSQASVTISFTSKIYGQLHLGAEKERSSGHDLRDWTGGFPGWLEDPQAQAARAGWVSAVQLPPILPQTEHWGPPQPTLLPAQPCWSHTRSRQGRGCTCHGGKSKRSLRRLLKRLSTSRVWWWSPR